jgi:hypothetical protein
MTAETGERVVAPDGPPETPVSPPHVSRWRRFTVAALLVIGCVLTPVAVAGVWIHGTLLDTDQYVSTIGPLASDPQVQGSIADRVSSALIKNTDAEQRLANALPARARFAASSLTQGFERFVHGVALKFAQSDAFETLWERANRRAHSAVVALLEGKGTDTVATRNGQVVVQLGPIVQKVQQRLEQRGVDVLSNVDPSRLNRDIVLVDSSGLRRAQSAVDALDTLAIVLPIVTVLVLGLAVILSRNRRKTLLHAGLGVALAVGLVLVAVALGRTVYLDALGSGVNRDTAGVVYDQLVSFLHLALRTVFVVGIVVAIGAALAGPGALATRIREGALSLTRRGGTTGEPSAVGTFAARHRSALRILILAAGFVVLVALSHPGPWAVVAVAATVVLLLLLLEWIANRGSAPPPATVARPSAGAGPA